jgi:sulfate adenylyltransferase
MIKPHGADALKPLYVSDPERRSALIEEAEHLPSLFLSSASTANAVMLGGGYFTPLDGFMGRADALSVAREMHTASGLFWPIPVLNLTTEAPGLGRAKRVALRDFNREGHPILAVQTVESIEELTADDMELLTRQVFRTLDPAHPGVEAFNAQGRMCLAGPIEVLHFSYFRDEFPATFRTAWQIREEISALGWRRVVAFQTRNPMHRAHEELCRMAHKAVRADGVLIHMLLGRLKKGDIPAEVRDRAIRRMVDRYFPAGTVLIAGYGFDMLYAGPREAVLHAIFRQNAGCTHLIVGRDHAGVGSYYGPFDAQAIFREEVPPGALEIQIFEADHTAWSKKLNRVVMMRDHPDHTPEDYILLSGTRIREMLSRGELLPEEFSRPEVSEVLMDFYRESHGPGFEPRS